MLNLLYKKNVLMELSKIKEIKEVYEVTGEYDVVSIISTSCLEDFRELLHKQILRIKGIKSTVVTVILHETSGSKTKPLRKDI